MFRYNCVEFKLLKRKDLFKVYWILTDTVWYRTMRTLYINIEFTSSREIFTKQRLSYNLWLDPVFQMITCKRGFNLKLCITKGYVMSWQYDLKKLLPPTQSVSSSQICLYSSVDYIFLNKLWDSHTIWNILELA